MYKLKIHARVNKPDTLEYRKEFDIKLPAKKNTDW